MKRGPKPKRREINITMGFHPDEYAEIKELAQENGLTFHDQCRKMQRLALDIERAIVRQLERDNAARESSK